MTGHRTFLDEYEQYEAEHDPRWQEQWVNPKRRANHRAKKSHREVIQEIAEGRDLAESVTMSYQAARFEEDWLLDSLRPFYDQNLVRDVVARVKGGKEANVYRCLADPSTGHTLVAAKVYRPRKLRNLRNDGMYRSGRPVLSRDGKVVKSNDDRTMRAIGKKTAFGQQVSHTSWLMYEYVTLQRLHEAGAAVPQPLGVAENAILMGYRGDESRAAPTLHEITLGPAEAATLFAEALRNVELMLGLGLVHGDLSAYNILYWEGTLTLIDFPQVTDCATNRDARFIFGRDVERLCDYFAAQGVPCNAEAIAEALWERHAAPRILPDLLLLQGDESHQREEPS